MNLRTYRAAIVLIVVAAALLTTVVTRGTFSWIGMTFPGFFVMANRVVPSISLPDWKAGDPARLFQHEVLAVDGEAVADGDAVYAAVRDKAPGTPVRYTVRAASGDVFVREIATRRFAVRDYVLLFAAFLLNGVGFLAIGIFVAVTKPRDPASAGLLGTTLLISLFVITACDLYGPARFFRVHVATESLMAAGCLHLALVFPVDRIPRRRGLVLTTLYLLFGGFAVWYQFALGTPVSYTTAHLVASVTHGIGGLALSAALTYDLIRSKSPLIRRRVGVVLLGVFGGYVAPGVLMAVSAMRGGEIPLNAAAFSSVLFPASVGYAIVKQDLFEIDVMLRRTTTYAVTLAAVALLYFVALSAMGAIIPAQTLLQSPLAAAMLNLVILFLIAPVKGRVQDAVDRLFFRQGYRAEAGLSELSHGLAGVLRLPEVLQHTTGVLAGTVSPLATTIMLTADGFRFRDESGGGRTIELAATTVEALRSGQIVTRYAWDEAGLPTDPGLWTRPDAEVVVPIRSGDSLIGLMVLGGKASGRMYTDYDRRFLAGAAAAIALAAINARAFEQLAELNSTLEQQVGERTAALEGANEGLNRSYDELRVAYEQLERNQRSLLRADRMATLGRLAAGIAHEVNSPLGAVQNALKVLGDLAQEYLESIEDPRVTAADHRQIAHEMVSSTRAAVTWAQSAAEFIGRVKLHGRDSPSANGGPFRVASVIEEVTTLLAHRLRAASCQLRFAEAPEGVTIAGDAGRFRQVMVNLIGNALDAYEDACRDAGRIEVDVRRLGDRVTISVRDWAGGIPAHVLPRIFDELYTTKDPGRGTGLGLWICRNLVEETFAGTLTVESKEGVGSVFAMTLASDVAVDEGTRLASNS